MGSDAGMWMVMSKTFRPYHPEPMLLMPVALHEWLPAENTRRKSVIVLVTWMVYLMAFLPLHHAIGDITGIFITVPVLALWGERSTTP